MKNYSNIVGSISAILILSMPIFFAERFSSHYLAVQFYKILVISGFILFGYYSSRALQLKFRYVILLFLISEIFLCGCFAVVKNGGTLPYFLEIQFKYIYKTRTVNSIQYDPKLATYDKELFYKLKPGNHSFKNLEFQNEIFINSLGVRDDELSLQYPEIVCIGDSFTMGWGTEKEDCFESVIEKQTQKRTLNLGISSYGTAREYLILNKIKLDSCKLLIIQFCENDVIENRKFVQNNFSLNISSLEAYEAAQRTNQLKHSYFPLKWTFEFLSKMIRSVTGFSNWFYYNHIPIIPETVWIKDFVEIVNLIQEKYKGKIIIFHLANSVSIDLKFSAIKEYYDSSPNENIYLFDANELLKKNDYFYLDPHIHSSGHQKLAHKVIELIDKNQLLE